MPHNAASDQGLHYLLRPVCPNMAGTSIEETTLIISIYRIWFRGKIYITCMKSAHSDQTAHVQSGQDLHWSPTDIVNTGG